MQKIAVETIEMIEDAPPADRLDFVRAGLANPNPAVQRIAAKMIRYAPWTYIEELTGDVTQLVRAGFANSNPEVQKTAAEMIRYAAEADRLDLIRVGLAHPNPAVQRATVMMIGDAPWMNIEELRGEITRFVRAGLAHPNPEVQRTAVLMIEHAPSTEKSELFLRAKSQLGDRLIEPPLYDNMTSAHNEKPFQRTAFEKTGSETTLLGGTLKEKIIIRHIEPKAFLAWQKIFEDYHSWQDAGFDYVPVEPIQSYRLGKDEKVNVYSSVLDLSLYQWKNMTNDFATELNKDLRRIKEVLKKLNITHGHTGHTHEGNFCLRFFRDQEGHVDFSRKPRLYLIDFDQAVSQ
ncbi:MAG: hypothetical protein NUV84_01800 [Candidatus Uhrbacteria bacterium]|nr:hypothetical protein [Candidatus Uhrbacteria bacterium]